jgi:hypothetical protein
MAWSGPTARATSAMQSARSAVQPSAGRVAVARGVERDDRQAGADQRLDERAEL